MDEKICIFAAYFYSSSYLNFGKLVLRKRYFKFYKEFVYDTN
jgi:hypothetical protein